MSSVKILSLLITTLLLTTGATAAEDPCIEFFECSSSPQDSWFGLHLDGSNYGVGQSFTMNCGSRLETVSFKMFWGTDYGDVRSLAYGDTIHLSIMTVEGVEQARKSFMVDANVASRTLTFYFTADNVLLLPGTYVAACWTDVAACGGFEYYNVDTLAGSRFTSVTAANLTTWSAAVGEATHTIALDSDVTPIVSTSWDAVKAVYR